MREVMLTIIVTSIVAVTMLTAIRYGQQVADLEHAVTVLERELRHNQTMLDDAKRIIPHLERRVAKVDTDMTTREVIWHLQEAIGDCPNVEVY